MARIDQAKLFVHVFCLIYQNSMGANLACKSAVP